MRFVSRLVGCVVALLVMTAPVAHAGLLSGVLPGLVSPSDTPATCDKTASQPFARFGDSSNYILVPGGSFESGAPGWTLAGGAVVGKGNEPYSSGSHALSLPAGSSATTPATCYAPGDLKMRFFAKSSGSTSSYLQVKVVVKSLCGLLTILDGGQMSTNSVWVPSPKLALTITNLTSLISTDAVSFKFVPVGSASWQVDDVYLDPFKDG